MEQEFEAGRMRVTQVDDHLRMARQNSEISARSAANTKSSARATIPSASTCAQSCLEELNAQPEDLIAGIPAPCFRARNSSPPTRNITK